MVSCRRRVHLVYLALMYSDVQGFLSSIGLEVGVLITIMNGWGDLVWWCRRDKADAWVGILSKSVVEMRK
jgi:hypothetical protein